MPDSYGKRQRDAVKARKAAAREERRIARRERRNQDPLSSDNGFSEGTPDEEAPDEEAPDEAAPGDPTESDEVVDLTEEAQEVDTLG